MLAIRWVSTYFLYLRSPVVKPLPPSLPRFAALLAAIALTCTVAGCSTSAEITTPTAAGPESPAVEHSASEEPESSTTDAAALPETAVKPPSAEDPGASDTPAYHDLPAYDGSPYVYVNDGEPAFTDDERAAAAGTELYGELDALGRCTATFAVVGTETMPTEERGSIGEVRPTGWKMGKYDFVDGKYLYNRCHLLGFQLTGENANVSNLITGTRYMNVEGMLPFENAVADYVHATGNHVLMRATPVFDGDDLVARGVHMMAESVEDGGDGVAFNVFVYNVQPGVVIDYRTGENMAAEDATPLPDVSGDGGDASSDGDGTGTKGSADGGTALSDSGAATEKGTTGYVLNTNSKKFHVPSCSSVDQMSAKNRQDVTDTRENIIGRGFDPCKRCNP
ncbi:DNA-entry nuclease [Enterorhabdus sp. NM05_H27]|nr:DNA-entry nuclease [Enterorhabdus sp. NM05_H27]